MIADPRTAAYDRVREDWPFVRVLEGQMRLPDCLLYAVGWRETLLQNVIGDLGHGHGVWQLDNRSHVIPPGFDQDVNRQAYAAGVMLGALLAHYPGRVDLAACAYNAGVGAIDEGLKTGQDPESYTGNGHYGLDVVDNLKFFHRVHIYRRGLGG